MATIYLDFRRPFCHAPSGNAQIARRAARRDGADAPTIFHPTQKPHRAKSPPTPCMNLASMILSPALKTHPGEFPVDIVATPLPNCYHIAHPTGSNTPFAPRATNATNSPTPTLPTPAANYANAPRIIRTIPPVNRFKTPFSPHLNSLHNSNNSPPSPAGAHPFAKHVASRRPTSE